MADSRITEITDVFTPKHEECSKLKDLPFTLSQTISQVIDFNQKNRYHNSNNTFSNINSKLSKLKVVKINKSRGFIKKLLFKHTESRYNSNRYSECSLK